jgi:hypothetical protein
VGQSRHPQTVNEHGTFGSNLLMEKNWGNPDPLNPATIGEGV